MKHAIRLYSLLVTLYPRGFRETFGAQMRQTFADHYEDVERSEGHVGLRFWLALAVDELQHVGRQHADSLTKGGVLRKAVVGKAVVVALFFLPLYAACLGLMVNLALALPHPHVSGIFVVIAIASVVLVLPGIVSLTVSCLLVNALASIVAKDKSGAPGSS